MIFNYLLSKWNKWKETLNKELGVNELFTLTKYGQILTEDGIKDRLFRDINDQIKSKVSMGNYTLILDLIGDYERYQSDIITHYTQLGLSAQIIDVKLDKSESIIKYLLITWRR